MKIEMITLHSQNNNFGTVLQAYALNRYLSDLGYEVETVDYRPFYSNGGNNLKAKIKILLVDLLFLPYFVSRNKKFNSFIYSVKLSKKYKNFNELLKNPPKADIYLTGSDQIWNPKYLCGNDDAFYLKFVESNKKIAFSSSVGIELDEAGLKKLVEKTSSFKYLGVREEISFNQLSKYRENVKHVCDTVFLLNREHYEKLESPVNCVKNTRYVLVYAMEKSDVIDDAIAYFRRNSDLKIVCIGGFRKKCDYDIFVRDAGPGEFLYLFHHASYVLTSSFHGTAFSLIFNRQFSCVRPLKSNERLKSILFKTMLNDRLISGNEDLLKNLQNYIDYKLVNNKLEKFISNSKAFLDQAIEGVIENE